MMGVHEGTGSGGAGWWTGSFASARGPAASAAEFVDGADDAQYVMKQQPAPASESQGRAEQHRDGHGRHQP